MKLKKLFKEIPGLEIKGPKDVEITGVCTNSRLAAPGNLFIAKKGRTVNGAQFIPGAIQGGAVAVLTDMYDPTLREISQVICSDVSKIEGEIAARYNQYPSDELLMCGVTGTNGKTTTSYLLREILEEVNGPCGQIGTIEYILGSHRYPATHTTPEVTTNQKMLREMVNHGCRSAVMEVTSHALDQGRVNGIDFDIAVFTNLSQEHLDYHGTMENYCQAKSRLFTSLERSKRKKKQKTPTLAVVNRDDPHYTSVLKEYRGEVVTFGIDNEADLKAADLILTKEGTEASLSWKGETLRTTIPLVGRFNMYNALAACAVGLSLGLSLSDVAIKSRRFSPVPGRLESIPNDLGLKVYVDFAHTPDALENVLVALKEFKTRRLLTLFGCGGDRDKTKRSPMAQVSEYYSDLTVITSDNPRSEDPEAIIDEIAQGFSDSSKYITVSDRREAIDEILKIGKPEDIILIAGRGHEPYQNMGRRTIEFDDRTVVGELLNTLTIKG